MKVWVTGASGFTGQHLIQILAEAGHEVVAIHRAAPQVSYPENVQVELVDLDNASLVEETLNATNPNQIYHLAGQMPPADAAQMWDGFVKNSYHLLSALRSQSQKARVVVAGSAAEYLPNETGIFSEKSPIGGLSDYGRSKSAQSMLCLSAAQEFELDLVIARGFNFLGPGMSPNFVVGQICKQLQLGADELNLGNLNSERDFLDIRDVASAYVSIMEKAESGSVTNVCSGVSTKIGEIVELACEVFEAQPKVVSKARNHGFDIDRAIGDSTMLNEVIDWTPRISLRESLTDMRSYASK